MKIQKKRNRTLLKSIVISPLILSINPLATVSANPLTENLLGYGCLIEPGNYATSVITITNADLVKAHGVLAPNTTITHVVNFNYDFGVIDTSCLSARASVSLESTTLPITTEVSFDSLVLNGGFSNRPIVNNSGSLTLTLTMTTQTPVTMATPFSYSIPFTINTNVTIPK